MDTELLDNLGYKYLWHVFREENWNSILDTKMIYCEYDRYRYRIKSDGAYSITPIDFNEPWRVCPGQYPGLYMGLTNKLPQLGEGEMAVLFSKDILKQHNWHLNLFDRNGTVGFDTYTCENIIMVPPYADVERYYIEKAGRYHNEVVFHDSIPLQNAVYIYKYDQSYLQPIEDYGITHKITLDIKSGAYLYYSDIYYTGMEVPYYHRDDYFTTTDEFHRDYCLKYLGKFRNVIDDCYTKLEIDDRISSYKIDNIDLMTHLYINRQIA